VAFVSLVAGCSFESLFTEMVGKPARAAARLEVKNYNTWIKNYPGVPVENLPYILKEKPKLKIAGDGNTFTTWTERLTVIIATCIILYVKMHY